MCMCMYMYLEGDNLMVEFANDGDALLIALHLSIQIKVVIKLCGTRDCLKNGNVYGSCHHFDV